MNVTEQQMLDRMQQMAAAMATSLPQAGQDSSAPKTEKGDSFKDMMDKAKDQKVEASKKSEAPKQTEKAENVQKTEDVQKTEKPQTEKAPVKTKDGKTVELTAEQAAMLAAGYAKLIPSPESDMMLFVTVQDENGNPILPLKELENGNYAFQGMIVDDEAQWTMEPTPELVEALEQLLQKTNDPRPMDAILGKLAYNEDGAPIEDKMEIVISEPEAGQAGSDEDDTGLDAQVMTARQPLFKDVEAAPVKVGENFELDTQQPDMDDQLADAIRSAAQQGLRQVEIKLSPENLGSLTIKLTQSADGALQVVLHTSTAKAATLLTQHLDRLDMALQNYGQTQVRVEVQHNEDSQQAQQQFQQADPDGRHGHQQQQQQRQEKDEHSGDFLQRLRLGLVGEG